MVLVAIYNNTILYAKCNNTGNMGNRENRGKRERNRRHRLNRGPGEQRETKGIEGRGGMWGKERISEIERMLV